MEEFPDVLHSSSLTTQRLSKRRNSKKSSDLFPMSRQRQKTEIFYIEKCDVGAAKMRLSILCVAIIFTFSNIKYFRFRQKKNPRGKGSFCASQRHSLKGGSPYNSSIRASKYEKNLQPQEIEGFLCCCLYYKEKICPFFDENLNKR